jgi:hypothetical protein
MGLLRGILPQFMWLVPNSWDDGQYKICFLFYDIKSIAFSKMSIDIIFVSSAIFLIAELDRVEVDKVH